MDKEKKVKIIEEKKRKKRLIVLSMNLRFLYHVEMLLILLSVLL